MQKRGPHAAKMERWTVYTMTLQILVAVARATEDFRHISYEGKKLLKDEGIHTDIHFVSRLSAYRIIADLFIICYLWIIPPSSVIT